MTKYGLDKTMLDLCLACGFSKENVDLFLNGQIDKIDGSDTKLTNTKVVKNDDGSVAVEGLDSIDLDL